MTTAAKPQMQIEHVDIESLRRRRPEGEGAKKLVDFEVATAGDPISDPVRVFPNRIPELIDG